MADRTAESPAIAAHVGHHRRIPGVALEETQGSTPHCRLHEQKDQRGKAEAAAGTRDLVHRKGKVTERQCRGQRTWPISPLWTTILRLHDW